TSCASTSSCGGGQQGLLHDGSGQRHRLSDVRSEGADLEAIARHLVGANDNARAAHYAERAAEEAITKLAFDQAGRLLRMALETAPGSPGPPRRGGGGGGVGGPRGPPSGLPRAPRRCSARSLNARPPRSSWPAGS